MKTGFRPLLPPAAATSVALQIRCSKFATGRIRPIRHRTDSLRRTGGLGARNDQIGKLARHAVARPGFRFFLSCLLVLSWQLSAYSAPAANRGWRRLAHNKQSRPLPWGRYKKLARARSIDGIDYVEFESTAPKDQKKQPSPEGNNSSDSTTDLDESDNALDDLSVDNSRRGDQNVAHFSVTDFGAVNIRAPGTTHFFLPPNPSFYCLHQHIRERAPPTLT